MPSPAARSSARPSRRGGSMLRIGLGAFVLATLLGALWLAFPAAEGWLPGADVLPVEVQIPFAGRMVAADLYRSGRPRGVVLLVHGLSAAGRRQPDLARLARLLARHGPL